MFDRSGANFLVGKSVLRIIDNMYPILLVKNGCTFLLILNSNSICYADFSCVSFVISISFLK